MGIQVVIDEFFHGDNIDCTAEEYNQADQQTKESNGLNTLI